MCNIPGYDETAGNRGYGTLQALCRCHCDAEEERKSDGLCASEMKPNL